MNSLICLTSCFGQAFTDEKCGCGDLLLTGSLLPLCNQLLADRVVLVCFVYLSGCLPTLLIATCEMQRGVPCALFDV